MQSRENRKKALRKKVFSHCQNLTAAERHVRSQRIVTVLQKKIANRWPQGAKILCFAPTATEPAIFPLFESLWPQSQFQLYFPKITVDKEGVFSALRVRRSVELNTRNGWGILEPTGNETIDPRTLDLVLVPALALDSAGQRLGHGQGFYDRFLQNVSSVCQKWGVIFACQKVEKIPTAAYDIPVNAVIDEDGFTSFSTTAHGLHRRESH